MFTIVNGYPLSGKSEYLFEKIKNSLSLGREVVFLTPEQQLVYAEREIIGKKFGFLKYLAFAGFVAVVTVALILFIL